MKDIGADTATGAPQEGGKKGKNAAKRKNDESGAAVGAEQPQVISKRQAKKLRLAQKEAAAAPAPRATTEKS
ncbi:V-type ATPase assembly factor PKR1 [Verticillium dahliae VDG1]|nr:V-type ATPase assembly factor PKR1 [Verticillium dahliae VDG1]